MRRSSVGRQAERWGLILAGGDGLRLRPLTRIIAGDEHPKQFCAVLGSLSLLERTCRRAALAIPPERTEVVLTQAHERYYTSFVAGRPPHTVIVQPENRGTAAAVLYGTMRIAGIAPLGAVADVHGAGIAGGWRLARGQSPGGWFGVDSSQDGSGKPYS